MTAWASVPGLTSPLKKMGHFLTPGIAGQAVGAVSDATLYQKGQVASAGLMLQGQAIQGRTTAILFLWNPQSNKL